MNNLPDAHQPASRAVEQVVTVEVMGAKEGLVVRAGEVLVMSFPGYTSVSDLEIIRRSLMDAGMGGRFVLIGGHVDMAKMERPDERSRRSGGPGRVVLDEDYRFAGPAELLGSSVEGEVLP